MDISMDIHGKSVDMDMDMDMDGKFHIHGKPDFLRTTTKEFKYFQFLIFQPCSVVSHFSFLR